MKTLLPALVLLGTALSSCAPHAAPASSPAGATRDRAPDPIWTSGTAVTNADDLAEVMKHLPPGAADVPVANGFKDVQVLHGADVKTAALAMHGYANSLGVKCTHCHVEKKFEEDTDKKKVARQMIVMTDDLNRTSFGGKAELTCFTCHQGAEKAEATPKDMQERVAKAIPPAFQIPAEAAEKPAREVFKNLELLGNVPAKQIPYFMGFFSAALGKDCAFCHVKDDAASDDKKEKRIAREMMRLSMRASATIDGTRGKLTCWTCHRGSDHPKRTPFAEPHSH